MNENETKETTEVVQEEGESFETSEEFVGGPGEQFTEALEGSTLSVEPIDYTPVIYDVTSVLASVILAGALMIVGFFMGIKLWEVPHK